MKEIKEAKWGAFYAKPVYGQESKMAKKFVVDFGDTAREKGAEYIQGRWMKEEERFVKYIAKVMKQYPGVVFQKYIKDFGNKKSCPELRMYYCGDEYQYSMCATRSCYLRPREEGGRSDFPMEELKKNHKRYFG